MTALRLITWMWLRGAASGCILGVIFATLIFPLFGTLFGLVFGTILGTATGLVTGIALTVMTRLSSPALQHTRLYRCCVVAVAMISTALTIDVLLGLTIVHSYFTSIILIATVAAGFFAWQFPAYAANEFGPREHPSRKAQMVR